MRTRLMVLANTLLILLSMLEAGATALQDELPELQTQRVATGETVILKDAECVIRTSQDRISWGCINSFGGCFGACSEGYPFEPVRVCVPRPGSVCAGRVAKIKVVKTNEGNCLRDCSCNAFRAVGHTVVEVEVFRCN